MVQLYNATKRQQKHSPEQLTKVATILQKQLPHINSRSLLEAANAILGAYTPPSQTVAPTVQNTEDSILQKRPDNSYEDCVQRVVANGVSMENAITTCGDAYGKPSSVKWSRPLGVKPFVQPAQPVTTPTAPSGASMKSASTIPAHIAIELFHQRGGYEEPIQIDSTKSAAALVDGGGEPAWLSLYNTRPGTHARGLEKAEANAVRERRIRSGAIDNSKPAWVTCMERFLDN